MRKIYDDEKMRDLANSIKEIGLIHPLTVIQRKDRYELVSGERRRRACVMLKLKTVQCRVITGTVKDTEIIKMHENVIREAVSPSDEAEYLAGLKKAYKLTGRALAKLIGRTEAYVSEHLAIVEYPDELQRGLADGSITFSAARELSKIRNKNAQRVYINHALAGGINDRTARQWRHDYEAAEESATADPLNPPMRDAQPPIGHLTTTCMVCAGSVDFNATILLRACPDCVNTVTSAGRLATGAGKG